MAGRLGARCSVRLKPRAKSDRVEVSADGTLDIAVTSPPVDGRANEHLIDLLSERLRVPKRSIVIVTGGHSRNKVVEVAGMTENEIVETLKVKN